MSPSARLRLLFGINLLLYFLVGELNSLLAPRAVYLHLDILFLLFFGLFIAQGQTILYIIVLGLFADARHATPPGAFLISYLLLWAYLVWSQRRIQRQNPSHVSWIALIGQLAFIAVLSLSMADTQLLAFNYWTRVGWEAIWSAVLIFLFAPFWCRIQKSILQEFGWNAEAELRKV